MFTTKAERIITQLVDQFLDRKWWDNEFQEKREHWSIHRKKGLAFKLRFRIDEYTEEGNTFKCENAIILFCGNTSVFYVLESEISDDIIFDVKTIPYDAWHNTSNHDSCWRSDGLDWISKLYFKLCKEVNDKVAPISLNNDIDFGFGKVFEHVIIDTIKDPEKDSSYWRKIINIERIK